jgi:DNA polymerase-1
MDIDLNLVETWEDAQEFMTWLGERRPVLGCDTETSGFDWWREELRLVQFGDHNAGWSIPWHRWGGLAIEALRRYQGDIVFHNAKFDLHFLEVNGAKVPRHLVHDTGTMAQLLRPGQSWGLKRLGSEFVDKSIDVGQYRLNKAMTKNRWTWGTVPIDYPDYWAYAALDPVITARLFEEFHPQLSGKLLDLYEIEVAVALIVTDMERRGARVDVEYCTAKRDEFLAYAEEVRRLVREEYGFEVGSNSKVAAQLQRDGIVLTKRTAGGAWSVEKEVLEGIDHPLARDVLNVRRTQKMADSYFGNYIDYADSNGILHPQVNLMAARTGRMSISRPAMQQVPKNKVMRDAVLAREGNLLVAVDFEQIEMRLLAHFAQDQALIEAFSEEGDFFVNTARKLYGDPSIDKNDPRRNVTKHASYAKVYGAGVPKFAARADIPVDEAEQFIREFNRRFPGVQQFVQTVSTTALEHYNDEGIPYLTTEYGRLQIAENTNQLYKLVNYMIQGTAADVFKHTLVRLDDAGLTDYLILPVHDECVFDVPSGDAQDVCDEAMRIFRAEGEHYTVPLDADGDVVVRWGDKYE